MPARKKCNYREVYQFAKEWGKRKALAEFQISDSLLRTIVSIGDEILKDKPISKDAKALGEYSPRELMHELARRGYEGKLTYKQIIDIQNF